MADNAAVDDDGQVESIQTEYDPFGPRVDAGAILDKFDYEIAKWIANSELKRNRKAVDEEMVRHGRLEYLAKTSALGAISDYITGGQAVQRENQSLLIDEYWSTVTIDVKYRGLTTEQIRGLLVIQNAFRTWIILKKYRDTLKTKGSESSKSFGDVKSVATSLYIQASVRRVIAKLTVETKIAENRARDKIFAKFCSIMKEGLLVTMFSRKYGTAPMRKISFDSDLSSLTFTTSFGTRGKIALKSIYKIHKGISETMYPQSRQAQLSRCICLECLGERVVDLELSNAQQAREMYIGFERLILLLSGTASPFYVDNFGIPRRAGASIIENAIEEGIIEDDAPDRIYKSKPDEMRFWGAVRLLQQEYDSWQQEQDAERREHNERKAIEKEIKLNRLNERQRVSADGGPGGRKVVKLVRFVDDDGTSKMIEKVTGDGDKIKASFNVYENDQVITMEKMNKKKMKYDEEKEGKSRKWKFNPFKSRKSSNASTADKEKRNSQFEKEMSDFEATTLTNLEDESAKILRQNQALDALRAFSSDDLNGSMSSSALSGPGRLNGLSGKFSDVLSQTSYDVPMIVPDYGAYDGAPPEITQSRAPSIVSSVGSSGGRSQAPPLEPSRGITESLLPSTSSTRGLKPSSLSSRRSNRSMSDVSSISKGSTMSQPFWRALFCLSPLPSYESDEDYSVVVRTKNLRPMSSVDKRTSSASSSSDEGDDDSAGDDEDSDDEDDDNDEEGEEEEEEVDEEGDGDDEEEVEEEEEEEDVERKEDEEGSVVAGSKSSRVSSVRSSHRSSHSTFSGHQQCEDIEDEEEEEEEESALNTDENDDRIRALDALDALDQGSSHEEDDEEEEDEEWDEAGSEDALADSTSSDSFDEDF